MYVCLLWLVVFRTNSFCLIVIVSRCVFHSTIECSSIVVEVQTERDDILCNCETIKHSTNSLSFFFVQKKSSIFSIQFRSIIRFARFCFTTHTTEMTLLKKIFAVVSKKRNSENIYSKTLFSLFLFCVDAKRLFEKKICVVNLDLVELLIFWLEF